MSAFRHDEGGQSVVLIAISLPLILSLLLLVIDGGRLYVERERIRNAAQLAAEAAVSLAADSPGGSQPKDGDVRGIVTEALQRNLPGEGYVADVVMPFRSDITTFNVKVSVQKEFRASIAAVRFRIGADAAAKLAPAASSAPPTAPPATIAPTPSPTPSPPATPRPTASPTPTPTPSATPRLSVTVFGSYYTNTQYGRYCFNTTSCYQASVRFGQWPAGAGSASYFTAGQPGLQAGVPGATSVYRIDFRSGRASDGNRFIESVTIVVSWPLDGTPYRRPAEYSVTVTR